MNYYIECITKKYFQFRGRASRKEFWMFFLINFIIVLLIGMIEGAITGQPKQNSTLLTIYSLLLFFPYLAATVRRLHDTDKSAWWLLLCFLPIIGAIILLIFLITKGTPGPNRFGPDPLTSNENNFPEEPEEFAKGPTIEEHIEKDRRE